MKLHMLHFGFTLCGLRPTEFVDGDKWIGLIDGDEVVKHQDVCLECVSAYELWKEQQNVEAVHKLEIKK